MLSFSEATTTLGVERANAPQLLYNHTVTTLRCMYRLCGGEHYETMNMVKLVKEIRCANV